MSDLSRYRLVTSRQGSNVRAVQRGGKATLAAALVAAVVATGMAAFAQEGADAPPAPMEGATITDTGWWNRLRPEVSLPTGQAPPPPTPGVPPGTLVVGASTGEPDAVAAVDIAPESPPGATVETFDLTLREVDDDGANLNTTFAGIVACPITDFWIGGENGVWETQPAYDCSLTEAPGTRAEDGTWTFDLRAIGQLWSDETVSTEGVVLVEKVEPPTSFRTVFAGDVAIGVIYVASGGEEPSDAFGGGGFGDGSLGGGSGGGGFTGGGTTGGGFTPPAGGGAPPTTAAATEPTEPAPAGDGEAALPTVPIRTGPGSPLGTLQWWTVPLFLIVLVVALTSMVALGPAGEPVSVTAGRGVTRALEARAEVRAQMEEA